MCMSFTDVPLPRQEQIHVKTLYYDAHGRRAEGQREWLANVYEGMPTPALEDHAQTLRDAHNDDPRWAPITDMVEAVLKARANAGAL